MDVFLKITLYSILVLSGLTGVAVLYVLLAKWLTDNSDERYDEA